MRKTNIYYEAINLFIRSEHQEKEKSLNCIHFAVDISSELFLELRSIDYLT